MRRAVTVLAVLVGVVPALGVMTSVAEAHHLENELRDHGTDRYFA
jgi:hypothetical protein